MITIKRVVLPPLRARSHGARQARPSRAAGGPFWPRLSDLAEVYAALVTGVRDYVRKNGFRSVILALSGGIDSALTATIAADAIGPGNVHVVLMPSRYSSDHSVPTPRTWSSGRACTRRPYRSPRWSTRSPRS